MGQCTGTTRAGKRCQIIVKNGTRCQYHQPRQAPAQTHHQAAANAKPGFVYIYALEPGRGNVHVFSASTQQFEPMKVHRQNESAWTKLKRVLASPDAKPLLIKVGFTTATPAKRLEQWHQQCKHNIQLVTPPKTQTRAYDFGVHGWPCRTAYTAEQNIHHQLWQLFGKGHVECGGCSEGKLSIHREWFLIPRHELKRVFAIVDREVSS